MINTDSTIIVGTEPTETAATLPEASGTAVPIPTSENRKPIDVTTPAKARRRTNSKNQMSVKQASAPLENAVNHDAAPVSRVAATPMNNESNLEVLESVIRIGARSFVDVGRALAIIRDNRKFTPDYKTFDDYLAIRWGFAKSYAHYQIAAAQIVDELSTIVDTLPTTESQARPLMRLDVDQRKTVWCAAIKDSKNRCRAITAKDVEEQAGRLFPPPPTPEEAEQRRSVQEAQSLPPLRQFIQGTGESLKHALDGREISLLILTGENLSDISRFAPCMRPHSRVVVIVGWKDEGAARTALIAGGFVLEGRINWYRNVDRSAKHGAEVGTAHYSVLIASVGEPDRPLKLPDPISDEGSSRTPGAFPERVLSAILSTAVRARDLVVIPDDPFGVGCAAALRMKCDALAADADPGRHLAGRARLEKLIVVPKQVDDEIDAALAAEPKEASCD